ncbi:trafficking protein particle complex subunit 6A, putative [Plasmodium ovale wallikeri]|uniref:Trafficking protein particle complex subunit 6A, putative n=1 Tax=Plasmodium ovale wallikeri TaxID=864142 RepID=A0A1A8Z2U0_PLAOA|nr:trafficking protein particle complex subunit 6A, putative [Plasmodium ovale wallikeri]
MGTHHVGGILFLNVPLPHFPYKHISEKDTVKCEPMGTATIKVNNCIHLIFLKFSLEENPGYVTFPKQESKKMSEGKISKTGLLLLINEIINLNIELLRNNELEVSSCGSSDHPPHGDVQEKRLSCGDEQSKNEQGKSEHGKNEQGKSEHGKNEHGKNEQGKNEQGKNEHGKNEHGKNEHGKNEHGKNEQGKNEQGKGEQSRGEQSRGDAKRKSSIGEGCYYGLTQLETCSMNLLSAKMKEMGKSIGIRLIERTLIYKNEFTDVKDILKFIGRDVWYILFNKNADKLQTHRKGVYIIVDNDIGMYLKHVLIDNETNHKNSFIHCFLTLIIGILKGILSRFKIKGYITYSLDYPHCKHSNSSAGCGEEAKTNLPFSCTFPFFVVAIPIRFLFLTFSLGSFQINIIDD